MEGFTFRSHPQPSFFFIGPRISETRHSDTQENAGAGGNGAAGTKISLTNSGTAATEGGNIITLQMQITFAHIIIHIIVFKTLCF